MLRSPIILPRLTRLGPALVVFLLLLFLLAACSGAEPAPAETGVPPAGETPAAQTTRTPSANRTPALTPTAAVTSALGLELQDLEGINLEFWHFLPEEQVSPLLRAFNQDNPWNITVSGRRFGNPIVLEQALAQDGTAPVLLGFTEQLLAWDESGLLADLAPYVDDPEWGLSTSEQQDFVAPFWEQDLSSSRRVGVPARRAANFLVYNETWAEEIGYSRSPETPSRFRAQACAANAAMRTDSDLQNDGHGGWLINTEPPTMLGWLGAFGSQPVRAGQSNYRFNTAQSEEAFRFLKSLIDGTCAWESQSPYPDEVFAARQSLIASASLVDLPFITEAMQAAGNRDRWSVLPFPAEDGDPVLPVYGPSLAIQADTPARQLAAWLFIRWLTSPETQAFWTRLDGSFPVRASARPLLDDYAASRTQWSAAWELLPLAINEPHLASWGDVQWALQDAGTQLFRSYFLAERIPATLQELDRTAAELSRQEPE